MTTDTPKNAAAMFARPLAAAATVVAMTGAVAAPQSDAGVSMAGLHRVQYLTGQDQGPRWQSPNATINDIPAHQNLRSPLYRGLRQIMDPRGLISDPRSIDDFFNLIRTNLGRCDGVGERFREERQRRDLVPHRDGCVFSHYYTAVPHPNSGQPLPERPQYNYMVRYERGSGAIDVLVRTHVAGERDWQQQVNNPTIAATGALSNPQGPGYYPLYQMQFNPSLPPGQQLRQVPTDPTLFGLSPNFVEMLGQAPTANQVVRLPTPPRAGLGGGMLPPMMREQPGPMQPAAPLPSLDELERKRIPPAGTTGPQ